jgi:hypothetical protein
MAPELKEALMGLYVPFWTVDAPIDIFLVDKLEDNFTKSVEDRTPDTDFLGFYYPQHPQYCRPAIKVCPERIMTAAKELCEKITPKSLLARAYPALFCKVVIHELGHALMDNFRTRSREDEPWHFLASRYDETDEVEIEYFKQAFPVGGHAQQGCRYSNHFVKPHFDDSEMMWHVIEESLANAIALGQRYQTADQQFIQEFVSRQSPPYKAGLKWGLSLPNLLITASNWLAWKDSIFEKSPDAGKIEYDFNKKCLTNLCLVHRLLGENQPRESTVFLQKDFEAEFSKHIK